jgi:pilus assembly protein CpaB
VTARRITIALVVALAVSGLFTYWLSRKVAAHPVVAPVKERYAASARSLDAGQLLTPASVTMIEWPATIPLKGAFSKPEDLTGRIVLYPLAAGEPIVERELAAAGSVAGLTGKIPPGMRAISLRSDDVVGVAGFLFPGTHVDVLVTYRSGTSPEPETATVLQDVDVLAAGHQINPDPKGEAASVDVVTLMLKPEDAEKVVLASTQGTIHFVLRNGADRGKTDSKPITLSQLVNSAPEPAPAHAVAQARAAPKRYSVVTVLGNKQSVTSF